MRRNGAARAFLLIAMFLLSAGCEQPFEPIQQSELAFSVFGFLDASADTQWVRVTSVRTSVFTSPDPPGATVTLEHMGTGEVTTLRDSVFVYPGSNPQVSGDQYARNFWTDIPLEQGASYRLTATSSDGVSSTTSARVPIDADTVVVGIEQGRFGHFRGYLRLIGAEHLAIAQVVPGCPPMEFVHLGGGPDARADEDGELSIEIFRIRTCPNPSGGPSIPIRAWDLRIALSGAPWPYDPEWSNATTFLPDVSLSVEGGLGFLGGVLTRTVPYETCYVLGAENDEYCELVYTDRPAAVEGVVRERVETAEGCEPVPRPGAIVFLWENDRPDVDRSVTVEDIQGATFTLRKPDGVKVRTAFTRSDGSYRISALVPGLEYGVAVSYGGATYHQGEGLAVLSGETVERDIEIPAVELPGGCT